MTGGRALATVTPVVAATLVRAVGRTLRLTVRGIDAVVPWWSSRRPLIYALWHGRILMVPWLNARLARTHGAPLARVLASRSRDGELIARFARQFGLPVARGSSSRGGTAAARALLAALRAGEDIAVAPDGPRGPAEHAQSGVVTLAALAGVPIVPIAFAASPSWRLGSWDRLLVPRPFARAAAVFGEPLRIARDADRTPAVKEVEAAIAEVTLAADRLVST